jgi:hypothetical protein
MPNNHIPHAHHRLPSKCHMDHRIQDADQANHGAMEAIMNTREGVPTNKPNQSRAIPDTGHIKPLIKEAGVAEDESLNSGILFANDSVWGGGLRYDDVD